MKFDLKNYKEHIIVVASFLAITLGYFNAQFGGKKLDTHDYKQWYGSAQEGREYFEETGELALWTNGQFGGMPAYYVFVRYPNNWFRSVNKVIFSILDRPAVYFLITMIAFYILGLSLRLHPYVAGVGAVFYTFNTYGFVITAAGHFAKTSALSYLPGLLAGLIYIYRKKYLLGATLTALFFCFELIAIHPQMTYYFAVFLFVPYGISELFKAAKTREWGSFLKSTAVGIGALVLGVLPNVSQLWTTQEYTAYSTRGKSELTLKGEDGTSGLDKSYILSWSNGIAETWSLLIPDANGGASGRIADNKDALDVVDRQYRSVMSSVDKYWGNQSFTAGSMYSGAVVILLEFLASVILNHSLKWPLIFCFVITVMLC